MSCPLKFDSNCKFQSQFNSTRKNDFIKFMVLSPDGTELLVCNDSDITEIFSLPQNLIKSKLYYDIPELKIQDINDSDSLKFERSIPVGESIFDAKWYPFMNKTDPATSCFLTTSRDHPIHLWDSNLGVIRCSYSGYDHFDELEAAKSIAFNLSGDKIYSGANGIIRYIVFHFFSHENNNYYFIEYLMLIILEEILQI